jgi:histidine triad (HIT) family protein
VRFRAYPSQRRTKNEELHFMTDPNCLFCKIIAGKIPSKKVYEDDRVYVFEDINPQAPTHVLIIPKDHIEGVNTARPEDAEIIGYCHLVAAKVGRDRKIEEGYRTVYNVGPKSGQSVFHLHLHLLGGRDLKWPPG